MKDVINQEQAMVELKKGYVKAEKILSDKSKVDEILQKIEKKLKVIPNVGEKLAYIPVFGQLLKAYFYKEYTEVPLGTIIAITSALIYFISPIDLIPDVIPGIGYIDDAAVALACLSLVETDVLDFLSWRDAK